MQPLQSYKHQTRDLGMHLKTHSGERPNNYNNREFISTQANNLGTHLRMHSGEKSNKCKRAHCWEIYNFTNINLYWIFHASNQGRNTISKILFCIGYIMPTLGGSDIILRVSVRPYGRRDWKYTISKILICIGYIMPTLGGGL